MNSARRIIAAFMLLAWLCAGAHVALDHGGETLVAHLSEAVDHHGDHHHDAESEPVESDDHHHHDLDTVTLGQFAKFSEQHSLAPQWLPLFDFFVVELAAALRERNALHEHSFIGDSPPDERESGWLFVAQTARPVRGPSLA